MAEQPSLDDLAKWIVFAENQIQQEFGLSADPPTTDPVVLWAEERWRAMRAAGGTQNG
jgi:hypothetical protein